VNITPPRNSTRLSITAPTLVCKTSRSNGGRGAWGSSQVRRHCFGWSATFFVAKLHRVAIVPRSAFTAGLLHAHNRLFAWLFV
jgi:hypothetical protein